MGVVVSASAAAGAKQDYNASDSNSVRQLFIGRGNLYGFLFENNVATDCFVQLFDAASTGDVTLGVTAPDLTIRVEADGKMGRDKNDSPYWFFSKGCVVAVTDTSRTGAGSGSEDVTSTMWYYNMKSFG